MTVDRTSANVALLAAQAAFFGVTSALLVIPANGIFLAAYGAEWLPLTYIGIAILGAGISILIARALRRWTLPTVSVAVLVAVTATLIASWAVIAATGSAWPSVVQLILFPVLLQLGFVIIGGQAGRLLDLQEIKRFFPRVVAGFVVGFTIGGFAGVPLLDLTGAPEHLVVVSALSCAAFALLVRVTAWRRPAELTIIDQPTDDRPRRSLRSLLTTRFVALVFAYQVLSAMGSQVLDFLVFDRAAARYGDAAELTRFVALYTGVLNVVDLLFLVGLAGLLLWRFGLRLGLLANPVVVTALTVGMLVAVLGPGASSLALFALVVTARIVDIALTDGTTRGSINAVYQVLPVEERLAVQAGVEGIGVPLAIGATGVTLLAMNALDLGTSAIVGFAFVLCGGWSLLAIIVYLDYRRALAARLRRRGLDLRAALPGDDEERSAARRLLLTDDVRDIRLGLDLALIANTSSADLAELEAHEDAVVRVQVSAELARRGDEAARRRGRETVRRLATADDITGRRAAAAALTDLQPPDRQVLLRGLLADAEPAVRVAALEAVAPDDAGLAELVVGALDVPTTVDAALDASRRLGPPAIASAASRLSTPGPVDRRLVRLIAASDATKPEVHTMVAALVTHPDRSVSIAALGAIARAGATVEAPLLDQLLGRDAALSVCVLAASTTMTDADAMLLRALDDELQAARERVLAVLAVRHGEDRIGGARRALSSPDGPRRALGVEMLQVSLSRREAALVDPVVRDDLGASERLRRLGAMVEVPQRDRAAWVADLAVDDERRWASPWLQAVALYTELASARAVAARHAGSIAVAADPALAEVVRSTAGLERASAPGDLGPARSASSPAATIRQSSCREPGELLASGLSTVDAWRRRLSRECWDAVWRCDRAARRRRRRLVMGRGSTSPAMFGREAEVAATRRFFARLDAGPAGLVLSGTPGIGKTRLWSDALVAARAAGRRVVTTRPVEADAQLAFAGLRDLVGEAATEVLAALSPPQRHALAVVLLLEEPRAEPGDPAVVAASVVSALRVLRAEGSLVVAVDDAQWLDEPSRAALAFALRRMTDTERVGLLATSRPQGEPVGVLAGALPRDAVERVDVGPLTVAALHRTIVDRFGVVLRRPTLTRLHDMSGGNPLFALEIVRGLGDDAELAVPRDLTALLRARLAALSPRAVEVTMTAAALARPTRTVLERIEGDVDDELEEAVRAEIVEIDSDAVRFADPLLASVHYAAASPGRRRAAHARIAAAVGDIEERARHLARAARGPDEEVAAVLDEAVAVARRRGALEAAAGLAADAVTMTAPRSTARHRRVLTAVDLAYSSGDSDGAVQLAGAALSADLAPRQRAELLLALGRVEQMRNPRSASATLRAGLEAAADEPPLTAALLAQLAAVEYDLGRPVEALRLAQRAELIAERTGDGSLLALTVGAVSFFESDLSGEIQVARYERAIALEEAAGPSAGEWSAAFDYGQHLLDAWDLEQARPIFERLIARARADGDGSLAEYVDKLAFVELCAGRLADASARAHEAVELASQIGRTTVEVHALFRLGWIEGLRGNVAAAREACGRSLRLAADANGFTRGARLSLGYLESSLENYEAAWAYLDPSDPATGELPPERVVVHVPEAVEVLAALGRSDEARAKLQPFAERSAALDRRWALARAAHCNGLILASEGELEGAVQRLQDAVEQGVANGWPIPLGRALLALGSVQRRRRHKADARRSLQRAVALLDDAGAVIWRDRARRELGRIGGRSAPAGDELSPTEQEIADLVSAGCSNKQVADTLHLSVKTVEWNLSKIFRKLAVRSRAELIARGARAGNPGEPSG